MTRPPRRFHLSFFEGSFDGADKAEVAPTGFFSPIQRGQDGVQGRRTQPAVETFHFSPFKLLPSARTNDLFEQDGRRRLVGMKADPAVVQRRCML